MFEAIISLFLHQKHLMSQLSSCCATLHFSVSLNCSSNIHVKYSLHILKGQDRIILHQELF